MDIVAYLSANHAHLLYIIAGICILIELTVMGLSGPLFFFAIAALITGFLTQIGVLNGWIMELLSLGVLTALIIAILWKPLKKYQNRISVTDDSSDMIDKIVPCVETINNRGGSVRYSGVNWAARLTPTAQIDNLKEGDSCKVTAVDGNVLIVDQI